MADRPCGASRYLRRPALGVRLCHPLDVAAYLSETEVMQKIAAHLLLALSSVGLMFESARAQAVQDDASGNKLYEFCSAPESTWQSAICGGYVSAIFDMLTAQHMLDAQKGICLPD